MKNQLTFICGLMMTLAPVNPQDRGEEQITAGPDLDWLNYQKTYNKTYASNDEAVKRRRIWEENVAFIIQHNKEAAAGEHTYTMGVNGFTDLTSQEFMSMYTNQIPSEQSTSKNTSDLGLDIEDLKLNLNHKTEKTYYFNWTDTGVVSPVKDQGEKCGACWAFSVIAAIESQNAIKYGIHVELSEQELIDCCKLPGCDGCHGCYLKDGYTCASLLRGLDDRDIYPYEAKSGACRFNSHRIFAKIKGFSRYSGEEELLRVIITHGPASVEFTATPKFQFYSSGVFSDSNCTSSSERHAMLAVGYTADAWIVKNSYGSSWGEDGFMRVLRGFSEKGMCDIANDFFVPEMF